RPHREAFRGRLEAKGFDGQTKEVVFLDASEMLDSFMIGNLPDEVLFKNNVGGLIARTVNGSGGRVRAYGEMVDVLWREGNPQGAIRLEELWNDLADVQSFSLLCAYAMGNFYKESHSKHFEDICRTHSQVIPAESLATADLDEQTRWREITILQQRAGALQAEVRHRKELEHALREALAARRQAEEALRRSERELKDFIENAPIGLHWVGPDGTVLWANRTELDLLGYAPHEYVGHHIGEFYVHREQIDDILRRLIAKEEIRDCEVQLRAKDGSITHAAVSSNVLFENGNFVHTRCFTRNISDRKRLETERSFLLEATTALNRSLDYDARLSEVANLVVPRMAEWCAVDIAGEEGGRVRSAVTGATGASIPPDTAVADVLRSGQAQVTSQWMIVPMTASDRVSGAIIFVSLRHGYSAADVPLASELARRAAIAVENARLYGLAQHANRAKDEFLATLSHELRTPLTAILGWARMLTLGSLDQETMRTAVETIERSARTQASLIDDLLDLSRVVTGKLTLESELVDLGSVVESAVQTVQLAADAKGIELDVEIGAERDIVTGDPTRLQQIAWNLLSNAIKFSPSGARVSIALKRNEASARIIVRDNGRGISPELLPHVFEAFRQGDGANTRRYGGLGLGLAIVKYLTELHGGSVSASSPGEGRGATFVATLPLALRRSTQAGASAQEEGVVDLSGTSVLLVDDDADTRELVTAMLRRCGANVVAAESVRNACESLNGSNLPHILVTDIAMPDQDGFALLRHMLSGNESMRRIPVVALTASGNPRVEQEVRDAGFQAYVKKPVDPVQFARVIAALRV
ncbi:MAG TPA: ATP-binding protein, partial [Gemmatimonadaceae bacterium]|nr:ATP-binding protein [Gemmatimonadaceae bacterium]